MQITNGLSPADIASGAADTSSAAAAASTVSDLGNKDTFLQLLVAQIKNQDPLKPTDGIQFVTQLAQFSSLEQLIGIRGEIKDLTPAPATSVAPAPDPTATQTTQP